MFPKHWWVESIARFTFSIECQKGQENAATDALSQVALKLGAETVKSILNGVIMGMTERADAQDTMVVEANEEIHQPVEETAILARATQTYVN